MQYPFTPTGVKFIEMARKHDLNNFLMTGVGFELQMVVMLKQN